MNPDSDAELIRRFRRGDRPAFDLLYQRLEAGAYAYIMAILRDRHAADEVLQRLFAKFLERSALFENAPDFRSYFYAAARNEALAYLRAEKHHVPLDRVEDAIFDSRSDNPDGLSPESVEEINRILRDLSESQRKIVILKVVSGLTFSEIAALLDRHQDAVESAYRSALAKLKLFQPREA